jgi:hypothetical protein
MKKILLFIFCLVAINSSGQKIYYHYKDGLLKFEKNERFLKVWLQGADQTYLNELIAGSGYVIKSSDTENISFRTDAIGFYVQMINRLFCTIGL